MIVFYIFLTILFLITMFSLLILLSNIEIEINSFRFDSENEKHNKLEDLLIYIRFKIFDKITWLKFKIDNNKIFKISNSKILENKLFKNFYNARNIKKDIFSIKDIIGNLNIEVKQLDLNSKISSSDTILTVFSVTMFSTIVSIILARNIKKYEKYKYKYLISPLYKDEAIFKINLNCIIDIKIVNIINVIYVLAKKRSGDNNERTSDRRTYVCSNE